MYFNNIDDSSIQNPCIELNGDTINDLLFSLSFGNCLQFNKIKTIFPLLHIEKRPQLTLIGINAICHRMRIAIQF